MRRPACGLSAEPRRDTPDGCPRSGRVPPRADGLPRRECSLPAEPPQELLPYGRWADTLAEHFLAACDRIEGEGEDLGRAREVAWFPDRTYAGRTYVPATALTDRGYELYGF